MSNATSKQADPDLIAKVYEYDEDALAKSIGLQRRYIQNARESLAEGKQWTLENGSVLYIREGVQALLKALNIQIESTWFEAMLKAARLTKETGSATGDFRRARVTMITPNQKIVFAMLMDHPDRMTVRVVVGDNTLFIPSMEMRVRLISEPDLYELVGSRPRARGCW